MPTHRERDPLLELLQREHAHVLERITRLASGEGRRTLDEIRARLRALSVAEDEVLAPAFARISLREETQRLLEDRGEQRALEDAALDTLARSRRTHRLWKLRTLQLADLVQHHAQHRALGLVPPLRSQLPRVLYRALATRFAARYAEELQREPAPSAASRGAAA